MLKASDYKTILQYPLLEQIEELCLLVKEIQGDAAHIFLQSKVSDTPIELQDVLNSTEAATHKILDITMCIQDIVDTGRNSADDKTRVRDYVMQIMEACSFQDITGQQIKKVLKGLNALQFSIIKLAETAKTSNSSSSRQAPGEEVAVGLLNGAQLSHKVPSQKDIDQLFNS